MSSAQRRRLQLLAFPVLVLLLILLAVQQLSAVLQARAGDTTKRHTDRHRMEHQHEVRVNDTRAPIRSDVLFAETFSVREGDRLTVDLTEERVEILPARGREATVTVRGDGRGAVEAFEHSRFQARYRDGVVEVRTDPARRWRQRRDARVVTIEVPVQFSASVDLGSGSIHVERLGGDLRLDTGSGDITVGSAKGGRVHLSTGSGSIRADVLAGDVSADTGSGDIEIGRVQGRFTGDTGSGSIQVNEADVRLFDADTGSGMVRASLLRDAEVHVDTGSGGVHLQLPATAGAAVELHGRPIWVDDAFGFAGQQDRGEMNGRLGSGGPDLHISTGSGGIELVAR